MGPRLAPQESDTEIIIDIYLFIKPAESSKAIKASIGLAVIREEQRTKTQK